jgi:hypothetical protein
MRPGRLMALLAVLAACSPAGRDDRVELVIVNRATEALLVAIEDARCLDGAAALDGRTILIERPHLSTRLRVDDAGACAGTAPALEIVRRHLGGGEIGRIALVWDGNGRADPTADAEATYNACVSVAREDGPDGPRLIADFAPCS